LHVVNGDHPVADLVAAGALSGPSGTLTATASGGEVLVDAGGGPATVTCRDVVTANGRLHLVDAVLLPPPTDTESIGGSRLYRVDPATGTATPAGSFGGELGVLGVAAVDGSTLIALTDSADLVTFDPAVPATPSAEVTITGVEGSTLLALDRTSDGTLLAVSDLGAVYRIDPVSGVATAVGSALDPGVDDLGVAVDVGIDDMMRLVVASGTDLVVDGTTGAVVATSPAPAFAGDDEHAGSPARVLAVASSGDGLLAVEGVTESLVRLGADGMLTTIGRLGITLTDGAGLDVSPDGAVYLTVPG
jgi:Domain of unknown function (DUF4394)